LQIAFTVGMVGITYAAVPLYRMFCQVRARIDVRCIAMMLTAGQLQLPLRIE
jgi:cytochrome c oxidase assembly protein Cox11